MDAFYLMSFISYHALDKENSKFISFLKEELIIAK